MDTNHMIFFVLIPAFIYSIVTVCGVIFFDTFQNLKHRKHLPWILSIVLIFLLYPIPSNLYIRHIVLVPLLIYAPVPFLEKTPGSVFSKQSIFYGAFLTALWQIEISRAGSYYFDPYATVDSMVWIIITIVPASLIFLGIYICQRFLGAEQEEKQPRSGSDNHEIFHPSGRRKAVVILIGLLALCIPLYLLSTLPDTESCGGFDVYSVQESEIGNGTVIHLTEKDFWDFPKLTPIIRDGIRDDRLNGCFFDSGNCVAHGYYSCGEQQKISIYTNHYLEYQGRYYSLKKTYIN